jgi:hypothetical protein
MQPDVWFYNFCGNAGAVPHINSIVERIFNLAMEFTLRLVFRLGSRSAGHMYLEAFLVTDRPLSQRDFRQAQ